MNKILAAMMLALVLSFGTSTHAIDTSTDTGASMKESHEDSFQERESEDHGRATDVILSMDALFRPVLLDLERTSEPWSSCRVMSKPLMPADIGLAAVGQDGFIDTVRAENINLAAAANMNISVVNADEKRLRQWIHCLALYGSVIGQAYSNLQTSLPKVATVARGKDAVLVSGLGQEAMTIMSRIETDKVLRSSVKNKRIRRLYHQIIENNDPCRFGSSRDQIVCGPVSVILTPRIKMFIAGVEYYGEQFAGYGGTIKLHAGSSNSQEDVHAARLSVEEDQSQRQHVSISRLIPGLH